MFSWYKSIYRRRGATSGPQGRGRALPPRRTLLPHGRLVVSLTSSPSLLVSFRSKKDHCKSFISVWTPFGIPFIQNSKIGTKIETDTGVSVNRLVPKII